jgi:hypothetical protein
MDFLKTDSMKLSPFTPVVAAGVAVSSVALGAGQAHEFSRPSDAGCIMRPEQTDLGPPEGCREGELPHSRTIFLTPIAAAATTTTSSAGYFAIVVADPDNVQLVEARFPDTFNSPPSPHRTDK